MFTVQGLGYVRGACVWQQEEMLPAKRSTGWKRRSVSGCNLEIVEVVVSE